MAVFGSMTIPDGVTPTPVSHTFQAGRSGVTPDGRLYFQWLDFSVNGGVPIGANRIELYLKMPSFSRRGSNRATAGDGSQQLTAEFTVVCPTLESLSNNTASGINPQPTHAFDTTFWGKLVRNGRAAVQPVRDVLAYATNFCASQLQFRDAVLNFSPPGN